MKLYRPVGYKELELIKQSGMKEFPPRLPEQPIFYPVLNIRICQTNCTTVEYKKCTLFCWICDGI
jgi:hypothetical protein